MKSALQNKRIAILATDGFEQVELTQPRNAIQDAGGKAFEVSLQPGTILGVNHMEKGETVQVDKTLGAAKAEDFDGLIIPGGLYNPDALRANRDAVNFVRDFFKQSKPVAAICHGPWLLVEADVVTGRTLTSYPNIKTDIRNAGGNWIDEEVVCDEGLVTSRSPDDLDAFCEKAVEEFAEGRHAGQTT